jgi:hypothetical protein
MLDENTRSKVVLDPDRARLAATLEDVFGPGMVRGALASAGRGGRGGSLWGSEMSRAGGCLGWRVGRRGRIVARPRERAAQTLV